jgi:hypothetical protein
MGGETRRTAHDGTCLQGVGRYANAALWPFAAEGDGGMWWDDLRLFWFGRRRWIWRRGGVKQLRS